MKEEKERIFIAINLPENIKEELFDYSKKYSELPCRWTPKENLHITLAFLGYITREEIEKTSEVLSELTSKYSPFLISLKRIIYGPDKILPRMIWAEGEPSGELLSFKKQLDEILREKINYQPESRDFTLHITLGRLKQWEFRKLDLEERPQVEQDIDLSFKASSVEMMKSLLKREGAQYKIIYSFKLQEL